MNDSNFHYMPTIEAKGLTKSYGAVQALHGLDLTVDPGEIHGFLGPNGAGKSTTIRVLLGLIRADGGSVRVLRRDPWADSLEIHRNLAYVPGDVTLWPGFTGGEAIDVLLSLRDAPAPRRAELIERFGLDPSRRCRTYSKGNRQKVALVAALSCDVDLLLLDEPTSGLDPLMEAVFIECVQEAAVRGTTVLLSSHVLAEVEVLCERVTIIRDGSAVSTGTVAELRRGERLQVRARTERPADLSLLGIFADPDAGGTTVFDVAPDDLSIAMEALAAAGLQDLQCVPPSLEDVFLGHYQGAAADTAGTRS